MTYHMKKLGDWPADTIWNPGPGQLPRNDPRIVKAYATVRGTWQPQGLTRAASPAAPGYLLAQVKSRMPGWTVNLVGNGWNAAGQIELRAIVPSDTAAGVIKGAFFDAGQAVNAQRTASGALVLGMNSTATAPAQLINPTTYIDASDIKLPSSSTTTTPDTSTTTTPGTTTTTPDTTLTTDTSTGQPFFSRTVAGLPVWAIGVGGVAIVGTLAFMALKKPVRQTPAAVVANRRRRSRRRS